MTRPTDWLRKNHNWHRFSGTGFTLVELLVATFVAAIVSAITWAIMIESTKGDLRSESRRRLHDDWRRTTTLIQSEIALSDLIESSDLFPSDVTEEGCDLLRDEDSVDLKLRMHLIGTLPEIIYGVRRIDSLAEEEAQKWSGGPEAGVLIRCGPRMTIVENGKIEYIQGTYQQSIIMDNLSLTKGGLNISINPDNPSQKLVEFSLHMNENDGISASNTVRTKSLKSGSVSRINEVPPIPSDASICEKICLTKDYYCGDSVITLLDGDTEGVNYPTGKKSKISTDTDYVAGGDDSDVAFGTDTICTNRPYIKDVKISGTNGNYVMNGNPSPERIANNSEGVELFGGETGRNILLGTPFNDTITGGEKHDALIGRGGNDLLDAKQGNDSILPWSSISQENSTVIVNGGEGFDRIYLKNNASAYSESNPCDRNSCELQSIPEGGKLIMTSIEQLIFKDIIKNI